MWNFRKNVTYSSVDLLTIMEECPSMISSALSKIISLFKEKKIHIPQPFQIFGISEVEDVLRRLQTGNTAGKMAVEIRQTDAVPVSVVVLLDESQSTLLIGVSDCPSD